MTIELTVEGMACDGCEANVVEALEGVEGVTGAIADRETDSATVDGDVDAATLVAAVEDAGYRASA